jgi:hypothetical protein
MIRDQVDLPAELQLRWLLRRTAKLLELGAEPVSGSSSPRVIFLPRRSTAAPARSPR